MDLALLDICIYVNTVECGNRVCAGWAPGSAGDNSNWLLHEIFKCLRNSKRGRERVLRKNW